MLYTRRFSMGTLEEIETINVPVQSPKPPHSLSMKSFPIIHPHRVLTYLFEEIGIVVPDAEVRQFWAHARAVNDPCASCSDDGTHVPIGIHGDSARLWTQYKVEKMVCIWMNVVLFRPASVRHSRFLLFTCPNAVMVKNRTLTPASAKHLDAIPNHPSSRTSKTVFGMMSKEFRRELDLLLQGACSTLQ